MLKSVVVMGFSKEREEMVSQGGDFEPVNAKKNAGFSHLWIYLLCRISTSQSIIRIVLLLVLSLFAIQFNPWVSLGIFLGSIILGAILTFSLDTYSPKDIFQRIEGAIRERPKLANKYKDYKQQRNADGFINELSVVEKIMIFIAEPIMYTGICFSITYGFFDTIHMYNISSHLVVILFFCFLFLSGFFAFVRWRCQLVDNGNHRRLRGLWNWLIQENALDDISNITNTGSLQGWFQKHKFWYLVMAFTLLIGIYCASQLLLPFQGLFRPPHIITIVLVAVLAMILFIYGASSFKPGVLHCIKIIFMTIVMTYFYFNFFNVTVVLLAQIPLSEVISNQYIMTVIVAVSVILGGFYGYYINCLDCGDYEVLRVETTVDRYVGAQDIQEDQDFRKEVGSRSDNHEGGLNPPTNSSLEV